MTNDAATRRKGTLEMKKLWLLAVLITPFQLIYSQEIEHAPTVAQCRADQWLWFSKLEQPNGVGVATVTFTQLEDWRGEMGDCISVDPAFNFEYFETMTHIEYEKLMRTEHFLTRHNLFGQFMAEDEQGKH